MQYIEPYNTYIFVAGKNLCGTKIKFAGCREIFWGLGKKKGGGARRKITVLTPVHFDGIVISVKLKTAFQKILKVTRVFCDICAPNKFIPK